MLKKEFNASCNDMVLHGIPKIRKSLKNGFGWEGQTVEALLAPLSTAWQRMATA
jgi:hypothetical protein